MNSRELIFGLALATLTCGCEQESEPASVPDSDTQAASSDPEPSVDATTQETEIAQARNNEPESHPHDKMGQGHGGGMGRGPGGMGQGSGRMGGIRPDMKTLHSMFAHRDKIKRSVVNTPNGAEATTESDDQDVAALIQKHVPAMEARVLGNDPLPPMTFHPIFVELIKHSEDYTLEYEETATGMKVTYHADDPYVVMLVQEHSKLVSRFIKNGMSEIHAEYTLPQLDGKEDSQSEPGQGTQAIR